ncbi:MAG: sulfatase-like hydrolase/transferase [Pseudomonadales bacterium]
MFACVLLLLTQAVTAADHRPNVVIVLVDDAALMDFGSYGGEARTPHIDRLARAGVQFTQHHTAPLCAPSRAMLLTGLDAHRAGVSTIPEVIPAEQRNARGYGKALAPGVTTLASRLKRAGYRTYMTGKWHLGHGPGELPADHGFDHSFILDASGADNYRAQSYMPYYARADWFEDRARATLPADFYSSRFLVDRLVGWIDTDNKQRTPFLAYLAFQAIHIPVQAPAARREHYRELYAAGWDALRARREDRARELGLAPAAAARVERPKELRAWSALNASAQEFASASMAVNAAMLEEMDHHVGRLMAHLDAIGERSNTLFVITSDNGPEPSDPFASPGMETWTQLQGYTRDLANLGERNSYVFIGPEWAWAAAAPSDLFKFQTKEGGTRVPLIIAGPGIQSRKSDALTTMQDLAPTLLDLTGIETAATEFDGRSLAPLLTGMTTTARTSTDIVAFEASGNAALYQGPFKLVRNAPPWGSGQWELYQYRNDPGETRNLIEEEPLAFASLSAAYDNWANRVGVVPLPQGYEMRRQIAVNSLTRQAGTLMTGLSAILMALVLVSLLGRAGRLVPRARTRETSTTT